MCISSSGVGSNILIFALHQVHYSHYLSALAHLHTVYLTVGYDLGGGSTLTEKNNISLWCGECDACMDIMYAMEDFRTDWVERKKIQLRPPSLRRVEWTFRPAAEVIFDDHV